MRYYSIEGMFINYYALTEINLFLAVLDVITNENNVIIGSYSHTYSLIRLYEYE